VIFSAEGVLRAISKSGIVVGFSNGFGITVFSSSFSLTKSEISQPPPKLLPNFFLLKHYQKIPCYSFLVID